MNRVDQQDFFDVDLPSLEAEFEPSVRFDEFLYCLDKAIKEIMKDPAHEGAPLIRPPLAPTYRKKKFHAMTRPPHGQKADMRLVYRCDLITGALYVFGVGRWLSHQTNDIYAILDPRNPI